MPLSTIARMRTETVPETLNHFQQLNSATLSGVAAPGVSQADALNYLRDLAARTLPPAIPSTTAGPSRQFVQESGGVMATFGFAIIIAFLTLAALYESFRDPLVILISVPLSIAGALIFIAIGVHGASLNIYTQVGLVTLIGLISKHGILIVEVANEEQQQRQIQARGDRRRGRRAVAAHPDDHRRHGARRAAPGVRARRRRRLALRHRPRHLDRPRDRHAVYAVRGPRRVHADRRDAFRRAASKPPTNLSPSTAIEWIKALLFNRLH